MYGKPKTPNLSCGGLKVARARIFSRWTIALTVIFNCNFKDGTFALRMLISRSLPQIQTPIRCGDFLLTVLSVLREKISYFVRVERWWFSQIPAGRSPQ